MVFAELEDSALLAQRRRQQSFIAAPNARSRVESHRIDSQGGSVENELMFIRQNDGRLGRRWRENEFATLTDDEVASLEAIVGAAFDGFDR